LTRNVGVWEAQAVLAIERTLVMVADACSESPEGLEDIANALSTSDLNEITGKVHQASAFDSVADHYSTGDRMPLVEALDHGVAGLVDALAAAGCWLGASCRGHGPVGWSVSPVVFSRLILIGR
jgi:hypothetical protein